jgi:trigger factor
MQVSVETTDGLERKMTIAVPSVQVDSAVNARLQEAAKSVRLNGFRKGKIPFKVIKSKFGKGVRQEVVGELMSQTYYDAINQESLKPAGQPKIEPTNIEEGKDLEFVATFEVYPEITLPDFNKLEVERLNADINDTDIDEMIETLRQQRKTWEVIEREAADQDMTNIDYLGKKGGEEFEGGAAQGTNLVLGSERMIPGFEAGIIGKKAGDEFTLSLEFPTEYHNDVLAGAAVEFDITLNSVSVQVLPEVNEEFYKSFGVEEGGVAAFREEVSNNMRREMKTASRNKLKTKVMDALVAAVDVTVPESLVSNEILQLKNQALQQMGGAQGADPSMLPDELFKEQADRRVVLGLVLGEIIGEQNLQADPAKVRESVEELAATYESPDDVINWYYGNKEQLATIESAVVEDQVFDYIIEESVVTDTEVSYQEIIKPEPREGPSSEDDGLESENTESES